MYSALGDVSRVCQGNRLMHQGSCAHAISFAPKFAARLLECDQGQSVFPNFLIGHSQLQCVCRLPLMSEGRPYKTLGQRNGLLPTSDSIHRGLVSVT